MYKKCLVDSPPSMPLPTFTLLLHSYTHLTFNQKRPQLLTELGHQLGSRLFHGCRFTSQHFLTKGEQRPVSAKQVLQDIKFNLFPTIFGKRASKIEIFVSQIKHQKTGQNVQGYVISDPSPLYLSDLSKSNYVVRFLCSVLEGYMAQAGLQGKAHGSVISDKKAAKCEFIIVFDDQPNK